MSLTRSITYYIHINIHKESLINILQNDLVSKTTRVATRHNTTQHATTRLQHNTHEKTRVQHDTARVQQDITRDSTSATRDNASTERHNTSKTQHKFYFDLFTSLHHTRNLVY